MKTKRRKSKDDVDDRFSWNATYYTRLYGLTRDELRYILDPKEVHGEDFPGETFRVLKEKEVKQFGEDRTEPRKCIPYKRISVVKTC